MPIRTASLNNQIHKNGARLHLAMANRVHSKGADQPASEQEQALLDERRELKAAEATRRAQAKLPKAKPVAVVKAAVAPKAPKAPKAAKEPKPTKEAKKGGAAKPSRADKSIKKAENAEAAKKATKKSAKT